MKNQKIHSLTEDIWINTRLGDEIQLFYGKSLPKQLRVLGNIPVFGSNGIVGKHSESIVKGPGIIVGRKGSCGEVHYSEQDFWPIDTTYYVVPRKNHNLRFLYFFLKRLGLNEMNSHSTIPGLNRDLAYKLECKIPPYSEQRIIAAILCKIQKAIEIQEAIIEKTRELKKSTLHHVFTHGLRGEKWKETEIGPIPESWKLKHAEEIFRLSSGKTRPTNTKKEKSESFPYPVYGGNGIMAYADQYFVTGDALILGRVGEYCGAVHVSSEHAWISDNALYSKEWHDPNISIDFIAAYLKHFDLNRLKRKSSQPLITQGIIHGLMVPVPRNDDQTFIVNIVTAIDQKIDLHVAKKSALQDLFKTMLNKLMTGEIRVKDLEIKPLNFTA